MEQTNRFKDNGDGTVTDHESGLMWKQNDSYQDTSKWLNWFEAQEYIRNLNNTRFGGFSNWRMPTLEEAEGLHNEEEFIRDADRLEIYIPSAFSPGGGNTSWTSDQRPHNTAVVFYYRYGFPNLANKEGITKDAIRAVRNVSGEMPLPPRDQSGLSSGRYSS